MTNRRLILAILALLISGSSSRAAVPQVDLLTVPETPPYSATTLFESFPGRLIKPQMGSPLLLVDLDGDGQEEIIQSSSREVTARKSGAEDGVFIFRTGFPARFCRPGHPSFALTWIEGLTEDGTPNLVVTGHTEDGREWGFWILDVSSGEITSEFNLPCGPDLRPDNRWDGSYKVQGLVSSVPEKSAGAALILSCWVGPDREKRGVLAVDPLTGTILWQFPTPANPLPEQCRILDVDGDGSQEILFMVRPPYNSNDIEIGGLRDDELRLIVLDSSGRLKWTRILGQGFGNGFLGIADIHDKPHLDIVTASWIESTGFSEINIWTPEGELEGRETRKESISSLLVLPPEGDSPVQFATTTAFGHLYVFQFVETSLDVVGKAVFSTSCYLNCSHDVLGDSSTELVVSQKSGQTWVLDRNLQPLAVFQRAPLSWNRPVLPLHTASGDRKLILREAAEGSIAFARAPRSPLDVRNITGVSVILVLALALVVLIGRRRKAGVPLDPDLLTESRLNLLENLEICSHGQVAPFSTVGRLNWCLKAMRSEISDNERIAGRLREIWAECIDNSLPHLFGIVERARLAGITQGVVDEVRRTLSRIQELLIELGEGDFSPRARSLAEDSLVEADLDAQQALNALRRDVASHFRANLETVVRRVLEANGNSIQEEGITVHAHPASEDAVTDDQDTEPSGDQPGDREIPDCLIDASGLEFVLDNLVANSIQAMRQATSKTLEITWSSGDGMIRIEVRDTGCGIPRDDWRRALETHFTTKDDGGTGLFNSRKFLKRFCGDLQILSSEPGQGTTIRVTVPEA